MSLTEPFLLALPASLAAAVDRGPALDAGLAGLIGRARAAWPALLDDEASFVSHAARRLLVDAPVLPALDALHAADLCVAWAASRARPEALQVIEGHLDDLEVSLRRAGRSAPELDEVRQLLRARLFVGDGDSGPKIGDYAGRGTLRGWLRVVLTNVVVSGARRDARALPADDSYFAALPGGADDAEIQYLKRVYAAELREAFEVATEQLSSRDKNVLRYRFVDGLTDREIAALYRVHRATVADWIAQARSSLVLAIRAHLVSRLRLTDSELRSVLRLAASQVEITLARHLRVL